MMKKIFICCLLSLFIICAPLGSAHAFGVSMKFSGFDSQSLSALKILKSSIVDMAKQINTASSQMMKYGDMLKCNAEHGRSSYHELNLAFFVFTAHWADPLTWPSGCILLLLGFCIMVVAAFYIFDVAFNLAISLFLLPICLALWPFGWTKDKLKTNIEGIVYYVGLFIFLPMGILIAVKLVQQVMKNIFNDGFSFEEAFAADKSDLIRDHLGIDSFDFWKILFCYVLALRIVPLMATEFCTHFFSSSAVGNPMSDKLTQGIKVIKHATLDRAGEYGKKVIKHQTGKAFRGMGNKNGNFFMRALYRYGNNTAKTKK